MLGWGMLQMTQPNPKCCSKCCKMPKFNFSFLGAMFMVGGYAEMTHLTLNLKAVPNVTEWLNQTFIFGCDMLGWGYAENPPPQPEN